MPRCFISHSTSDRVFVERELLGTLKAIGLDPWYAEADIQTAEDWQRSIADGLESTDWFILVMSSRSAESEWVRDEVDWAFSRRGGHIVPILIDKCDAKDFHLRLPRVQHVDFTAEPNEARLKLIRILVDAVHGMTVRSTAITGSWTGVICQDEGPDGRPVELTINATLRAKQKTIHGEFHIVLPEKFKRPSDGAGTLIIDFTVTGGLMYDRLVQLNYLSDDPAVVQFGAIILELDDHGKEMRGKLVGYGAYSHRIVSGRLVLQKSD